MKFLDEKIPITTLKKNESAYYSSQTVQRQQYFLDSLHEHLLEQAKLADISEEVIKSLQFFALYIAITSSLPLKPLGPPGIGSVNLQDYLLTQLEPN